MLNMVFQTSKKKIKIAFLPLDRFSGNGPERMMSTFVSLFSSIGLLSFL